MAETNKSKMMSEAEIIEAINADTLVSVSLGEGQPQKNVKLSTLASVVAGLLYIDSIRILKIETTSGGSGVFGNKGLKSFFTYVVDADDRSKFIISHTYLNEGISNPDHKVIVSNALTYGSSNAFGTQNIEGSSGRVIFYLIKFL